MNLNEQYNQNVKLFNTSFNCLFKQDKYIARRDYKSLGETYSKTYNPFLELKESEILDVYCAKNEMSINDVESFIKKFEEIKDLNIDSETINLHIHKCDKCQTGYLIVKSGKNSSNDVKDNYFLGCTNYNAIGCKNMISERNYKSWVEDKNVNITKKTMFNKKLAAGVKLDNLFKKLNKDDK